MWFLKISKSNITLISQSFRSKIVTNLYFRFEIKSRINGSLTKQNKIIPRL